MPDVQNAGIGIMLLKTKGPWYWTKKEEDLLIRLTGRCKDEDLAWRLCRTVQAVRHKRCRLTGGDQRHDMDTDT